MPQTLFKLPDLLGRTRKGKYMLMQMVIALLISTSFFVGVVPGTMAASIAPQRPLSRATFSLDGVSLTITGSFIPGKFTVSTADNMTQMADSVALKPFREFQIESIPFMTRASEELLPVAKSGAEGQYRAILHAFRASQGAKTLAKGPELSIFGKMVSGETNLLKLPLYGTQIKTAVMTEYIVEAGQRLWLVRLTQEQISGGMTADAASTLFLSRLASINISSSTLNQPSTHRAAIAKEAKQFHPTFSQGAVRANNLPFPGWWSGTCDSNHYNPAIGWNAWQMNSGYNGVYPCGPRPAYANANIDYLVRFYSGAWGEYEFECVELSMRWMYLANGVRPYGANGNQVVSNYSSGDGGNLHSYSNYPGCCGYPMAGDVLSYCSTCSAGHTSVVIATSVDGNGNGSITVMEQNATHGGLQQLTVSNYEVINAPEGFVYGWLSTRLW